MTLPFRLKADDTIDSAPTPLREVPDLQALHVELSDLLARAERTTAEILDALTQSRDLLDGHRLARIWGVEAHALIVQAGRTREALARGQRSTGLLAERYGAEVR